LDDRWMTHKVRFPPHNVRLARHIK
jgi:hypothetical protein